MELSEELELPPWEKFRRFGKFPFKLCLHFALVALLTALIITTNLTYAAYSRSVWLSISNVLYPPGYARLQTDLSSPFQYFIYTQNQVIFDSNRLFNQYFLLANESVSEVNIYSESSNTYNIEAPYVVVRATSGDSTYTITNPASSEWPLAYHQLNSTNLRQFFNDLQKMDFHFYLRSNSNGVGFSLDSPPCFFWHWTVTYESAGAGQVSVDASAQIQTSCSSLAPPRSTYFLVSLAIFLVALWYQLLLLKAIARQVIVIATLSDPQFWTARLLRDGQQQEQEDLVFLYGARPSQRATDEGLRSLVADSTHSVSNSAHNRDSDDADADSADPHPHGEAAARGSVRSMSADSRSFSRSSRGVMSALENDLRVLSEAFETLTWKDRLALLNLWFLVSTLGNLFALIYACRVVFYGSDIMASVFLRSALGLACLMSWFALIQYLEFFPRYYIMISMMKLTVPRVSQFLLGVLPLFFGYALLGMICFGDVSDRFGDLSQTLRSLFAVVNGDIIYDTFNALDFAGVGGQLYLYVYILLFTYVVLMTIIAIVEEAFFEAQEKKGLGPLEYSDAPPPAPPRLPSSDVSASAAAAAAAGGSRSRSHSLRGEHAQNSDSTVYQPPNPVTGTDPAEPAATLRRVPSQQRGELEAPAAGKRELPENVRHLLRNVQRIPSLTSAGASSDWLNASVSSLSVSNPIQRPAVSSLALSSAGVAAQQPAQNSGTSAASPHTPQASDQT